MEENRKDNLKNQKKMLAVFAIILMLALIIGMGAMTYSKYITSKDTGELRATAAKWGFVINVDAKNFLGENYTKGENSETATVVTENGVAVQTTNGGDVVAPGTSGYMTISISGSAEVLSKISFKQTFVPHYIHLKHGDNDYVPVKWYVYKNGASNSLTDKTTIDDVFKAINDDLSANFNRIEPNENPNLSYKIEWKWDFEAGETDAEKKANNIKDTIIGYIANNQNLTYAELKEYIENNSNNNSIVLSDYITEEEFNDTSNLRTMQNMGFEITVEQIQE